MHLRLITLFILMFSAPIVAQDTISWTYRHYPPLVITKGQFKGQGFVTRQRQMVIDRLTEYKHELLEASMSRTLAEAQDAQHNCSSALIKTAKREEYLIFSIPSSTAPRHRLIYNKKHSHKVLKSAENGYVSLDKVLKHEDLTMVLEKEVNYTKNLTPILEANKDRIYRRSSTDSGGPYQMIMSDRMQLTIAYPFAAAYQFSQIQGAENHFSSIGILETKKLPSIISYFACPKTEWGKKVIGKINNILLDLIENKEYIGYEERWLDDSSRKALGPLWEKYVVTPAKAEMMGK